MKQVVLVLIVGVLLCTSALALPSLVRLEELDRDKVYGPNDPKIMFETHWNRPGLTITADLSSIETAPINTTIKAVQISAAAFLLNYTLLSPAGDGNYSIPVTAYDPFDKTTTTVYYDLALDSTAPVVSDQSVSPDVIFNSTPTILNATLTENNVLVEINVSGDWTGSMQNYSILNFLDPTYTISPDHIDDGESISWYYYAVDNAGNRGEGPIQSFDVALRTVLSISPESPNGCNGWFITEPYFSLFPDTGRTGYWRFDSLDNHVFTAPFKYEGIPGGKQILNFWSNDSLDNQESENPYLFQVDITHPVPKKFDPANGSTISEKKPLIQVEADEVYFGNSGINGSSARLWIDDVEMVAEFTPKGLDGIISYQVESDLTPGWHNATVYIEDNACLAKNTTWYFKIDDTIPVLNVSFPPDGFMTGNGRLTAIMSVSPESRLRYSINGARERSVCSECDYREKRIRLSEGWHNLSFIAINRINDATTSENRTVFVDPKGPRIRKTEPRNRKYAFGPFNVTYQENDVQSVSLFLKKEQDETYDHFDLLNCPSGKRSFCGIQVDLSPYDGETINYYFQVHDKFRNATSRVHKNLVDLSIPSITILQPSKPVYNTTKIYFAIDLDEEVRYLKYSDNGKRLSTLCSRCDYVEKTRTFRPGLHDVEIVAIDYAGNTMSQNVSFTVLDSKK